jgi:2-polyprenyl-3-methyl-5-hydroxy-6-metoxy-1,4-benzoquinol methylase
MKQKTIVKFLKFAVVGGIGAIITFSLTWLLTEKAGLWYMASMVFAVAVATVSNFILNNLWTFSVEKNMDDADYEWNAYYNGNIIQKWWKHQIVEKVLELIPRYKDNPSILDIGCGSSPIGRYIGSANYIGIDDNQDKIEFLKQKLPEYEFHTTKEHLNIKKLDVVMTIEVIEHLPSIFASDKFIQTISEEVADGGYVIIATPDYGKERWVLIEKIYGLLMPSAYANDHKVHFTDSSLIKACAFYGLTHVKTSYVLGCDMICLFKKS